jgi:hypothetical protein
MERDGGIGRGRGMDSGRGGGGGRGCKGGSQAAGPDGNCVCPSCGHKVKHKAGQPCYEQKCPKCKTQMIRE